MAALRNGGPTPIGQSGFMVEKQSLPPLLSFSALLVCILLHCRLRDWCGNLRKASGHVVCRLGQSASFCIFDSTFYFPHSAIPHFTQMRYTSSVILSTDNSRYSGVNVIFRPWGWKPRSGKCYFPSVKGVAFAIFRPWGRTFSIFYFPSLGTEITVWKTLFSVREGRKIRSCVCYFPPMKTDIQHNR